MALTKQEVSLPFAFGLNTNIDDKQLSIGNLTVLENVVLNKPGKLLKRYGYESIMLNSISGMAITNLEKLSTYKKELNLFNKTNMFSYIESLEKWSDKGYAFTIVPDSTSVVRTNVQQTELDSIHVGGLNVHVWQDSNGVSLTLMDNDSKNIIIDKQVLSATGENPKVVARDSQVYIMFRDTTAIKYRKFSIYDYNNIDAEVTAVAAIGAHDHYDALLIGNKIMLAYSESAADDLTFKSIESDDTLSSAVTVAGEEAVDTIDLSTDEASRVVCTYYDGTDAKIVIFSYNLGVKILAETSLETIANVTSITSAETTTGNYTILYTIAGSSVDTYYINKQTITLAGVAGTAAVFQKSVGLASKLFEHDSNFYVTTIHQNTLQSTYFITDLDNRIISKISPSTGGTQLISTGLPRVSFIEDEKYLLTSQVKGRLVSDNGTFFSLLGVNGTVINFDPDSKYQTEPLNDNMHISGGYLKMYDGAEIVEHGFHLYPETVANGGTAATGGFMSDGDYQYKVVYSWTDARGLIHNSASSVGFDVTLSGGGALQTQTITAPTLRLTDKSNVIIELYRTEASGTLFYKVTSTSAPTLNDKTVDTINIIDTISDADLIDNELLYSTGGELENFPAGASSIITSYKSRLFYLTPESKTLGYSKIQEEGKPVEFNDNLYISLSDKGGKNVVLAEMDDKVIIFKETSIYYISGDGPNNLGEQDSFIEPELISAEIGCSEGRSVILCPLGILFKSEKGIYLLDHSLGLKDLGDPVEEFNNLTITSAVVVPKENQIRFTTLEKECIVYNYNQDKWSTFTNHKGISAVNLENDYYYTRPDDLIYKQSENFSDNGTYVKAKLESGWISFNSVQGFQRVYKLLLLGQYKSPHKLKIKIAYNFKDAWVQEKIIDVSDFIDNTKYGESSPYGNETYYGTKGTPYQVRLDLKIQKCQSIKISIEDLQSEIGEGLELSNIMFIVGVKPTENKISKSQQYGAE